MKILIDDKIPLPKNAANYLSSLRKARGTSITNAALKDSNILFIRTVTAVNAALLQNSSINFVGSMTAGTDHVDLSYLQQHNIAFAYAPGANAQAVGEYILSCIAALQIQQRLSKQFTVGIVGVGHTGRATQFYLEKIGAKIICYDPPRTTRDSAFHSACLQDLANADVLCLHLPLTQTGKHPTYKMINEAFLKALKPTATIINAGRGATIDTAALQLFPDMTFCFDVWENEPTPDPLLVDRCLIATPHIAGYSNPAKMRATYQVLNQFFQHFHLPHYYDVNINDDIINMALSPDNNWQEKILEIYNPLEHTQQFKHHINAHKSFIELRRNYSLRPELNV